MTRINAGIPVEKLPSKLLIAEHREIKRIPNHLKKHGPPKKEIEFFKLGTGHVIFFISKGKFTFLRYQQLYNECLKRGFKIQDYSSAWEIYEKYPELYNDFTPSNEDKLLIENRINENGFSLL